MRKPAAIFIAIAFALLALFLADEFSRAAIAGSSGHIERGRRFGITVGESRETAASALRRRHIESVEPTSDFHGCFLQPAPPESEVSLYHDNSWRKGVICLITVDDKVTMIRWHYDWLAP